MRLNAFASMPLMLSLSVCAARAADHCKLDVFAELPVTMEGLRPVVATKINGADARLLVDSGAFYSMLSPSAAAEFRLPKRSAPFGFFVEGIGGSATPDIATVQTFTLANYPIHRLDFLVGGNTLGADAVGLLGQNLMRIADVEFDLSNGVMRFIKAESCSKQLLAYWATPSQAIGMVEIDTPTRPRPSPTGSAFVNGEQVRVVFDTGTPVSMISLSAAKRAGITPSSPGVKPVGTIYGIGHRLVNAWVAPLASFKIGGEEIQHTRALIADIALTDSDMLLGDDFFLSHRIYVANNQRKVYFTYNGGPVFKLDSPRPVQSEAASAGGSTPAVAGADSAPGAIAAAPLPTPSAGRFADEPVDAAGFMRRGTAYAARKDFERALTDLRRACELGPDEPDYFYELARVLWQSGHPDQSLEAINRALELKPDHIDALIARAQLRLQRHGDPGEDLNSADRLLAPENDHRLQLAFLYGANHQIDLAIHQYDLWIGAHSQDIQLATALAARCRLRVEVNQDLDRALSDCDAALHRQPKNPVFLDDRGLARLRRGELDRAIGDYDAAIGLAPTLATSLYGRGLAKLLKGQQVQGNADLAAAKAINTDIAARFASFGLKP